VQCGYIVYWTKIRCR